MAAMVDSVVYREQDKQMGSLTDYDVEVQKRAAELGLNTTDEVSWARYYWIAEEFYKAPLPEPWSAYADDHGQVFYYDHKTGESAWNHPLLQTFRNLYLKCQEEPYLHRYYRDLFNNLRQYSDQKKGWWALNLLASPNSGPPPTPDEVSDLATYLGINLPKEYGLMWVAKQAVQVALPPNWEELEDAEGNVYFYDKATGKSSIKHPMDDYFFALVQEERRKLSKRQSNLHANDPEASLRAHWLPFVDEVTGKAFYYNFSKKVRLEIPPWENHYQTAATTIQRCFRKYMRTHQSEIHAAITIQRIYRGYVVRDAVIAWKRECAALCIQTTWRMYWANKNFFKVLAVIHIQRAWRCHQARQGVSRAQAARVIQHCARAHLSRRYFQGLRGRLRAALTLQSVYRGRGGRRVARRRKYEAMVRRQVEHESAAALRLQAVQRGRIARRKAAVLGAERDCQRAAVKIQAVWRGHFARREVHELREHEAALIVQKSFRLHQAQSEAKRHRAAVKIQAFVKGRQARQRMEFMKKHRQAGFHQAATTIQANWRGYNYRQKIKLTTASVKIQAVWRGHHYRAHTRQQQAAVKLQSVFRGHSVRREFRGEKRYLDLIALRLQFLYRRFISRRHAVIAQMMAAHRHAMVTVIRAAWLGHKERSRFLSYLANRDAMIASATKIKSVWKGCKARQRYNLMRDKDAWAAHNAVLIQKLWRLHAAKAELGRRRVLKQQQRAIVNKLRPMYIEMYSLPDKVVRPSGHKLLDKLIIQDVCKDIEDVLGQEAVLALDDKVAALLREKQARVGTLDKVHHTLAIHWRLLRLPDDRWLELPPAGAPGWVSNKVVKKCKAELERVKKLRLQAMEPLARAAWADLENLRDELGMTDKWKKKLAYYSPPDEALVDLMVEQLRVLEDLYMPLSPLVPLVQHLEAHLQTHEDMKAATDPMMAAAAKHKALKRLSKHQGRIQEFQQEFPSVVQETLERLNQLAHLDLSVPLEDVQEMFGIPTEDELAADMQQFMQTTTGRSSGEAVLRSIIHYRKVKKMQQGDPKKAKKKKRREEDGTMSPALRPAHPRDTLGSPSGSFRRILSRQLSNGGDAERTPRPLSALRLTQTGGDSSSQNGDPSEPVRRRPARRKGKVK